MEVQHVVPVVQGGHDEAEQPPDPDEEPEPLEELDVLGAPHDPLRHTWPNAKQSVHKLPPVPHVLSVAPTWHVLFVLQHPAQVAPEHPPSLM